MTQDIHTIQTIARNLYNGFVHGILISIKTGKTRNNYSLWEYDLIDGWKLTFKFVKMVGIKAVEGEYCQVARVLNLTADWHTQASLSRDIMNEVKILKDADIIASGEMPFGKYKGVKVSDLTDLSYLCWLANSLLKEEDQQKGIDGWIKSEAITRAEQLGAIKIGQYMIDLDGENRFNKNTSMIHKAIETHKEISYVAEGNDGSIWSAYRIILPTFIVGNPYHGTCCCLNVDGKARRAKGWKIVIYDYDVEDCIVRVNGFFIERV